MTKAFISKLLEINEATVYRALSKLEKENLIEREPQKIISSNFKSIGRIKITSIALKLIGITEYLEKREEKLKEKANNASSSNKKDDLAQMQDKNRDTLQSLKKQSERNSFKEIQGKKVPQDLAWLVEDNNLGIGALFKLMRLAREKGKRLSDIVAVCLHALRKISGRGLFAYLNKLITQENDFAYVRAMREEEQMEKQHAAEEKRQLDLAKASLAGRKFCLDSGQFVEFDEQFISFFDASGRHTGTCPFGQAAPLVEKAIKGALKPIDQIPLPSVDMNESGKTSGRRSTETSSGRSVKSRLAAYVHGWKKLLV